MKTPVKRHKGPAPRPANDNSSLRDRLQAARMSWRDAVLGAVSWGAAMALSAQASLWLSTAALTDHYWSLTALAFCGAALAWPLSLASFRFISYGRAREAAFAAAFLCLTVFTIGVTSVMFAFLYRNFYAQWHGDPFTKLWLVQLVFTVGAALYQFAVQGLRLYLPLGVVFLFAASFLLARRHDRSKQLKSRIIP
ncbi:hypothetical protein IMCC20628_01614 [Hoeflea sp. IMCC20628]|uniref:hypothetical protein n=1 Tax=Hoeflea sp. IMCC20628 TaxID=1620421 RepID=UPI00063AB471|nr:hypothetical protein [Hoeflea sp. IMCC20628]AKI00330.1 hypothetical protein IMCC20628_01614 [Hoeflea sp. IMCC20628]